MPELNTFADKCLLDAAQEEANRQFIAAWLAWRGHGRLLPKRSDIDLDNIKHLLGRVILLELRGEDDILVRVAGSQLREHGGFEATGKNMRDLTPPNQWPIRRWRISMVAAQPCGARQVNLDNWTSTGQANIFETVTLPIEADDPAKPRLVLSNVAFQGGISQLPTIGRPQVALMPSEFRFLNLGAGIPDRISL